MAWRVYYRPKWRNAILTVVHWFAKWTGEESHKQFAWRVCRWSLKETVSDG